MLARQDDIAGDANGVGQHGVLGGIGLRFGKQNVEGDEFRLTGGEGLDQFGMQGAWPGPGEVELIEGILIDADDDDRQMGGERAAQAEPGIEAQVLRDIESSPVVRQDH